MADDPRKAKNEKKDHGQAHNKVHNHSSPIKIKGLFYCISREFQEFRELRKPRQHFLGFRQVQVYDVPVDVYRGGDGRPVEDQLADLDRMLPIKADG